MISLCIVLISGRSTAFNVTVGTMPRVALQKGSRGLLPCEVQGAVDYVDWVKGPSTFGSRPLVFSALDGSVWKKKQAHESGQYDMASDFSLIISDVDIHNEDIYSCTVKVLRAFDFLTNTTLVSVIGKCITSKLDHIRQFTFKGGKPKWKKK